MQLSTAPIFIVGCPRSGTSLLRDLLRAHPRIGGPDESYFIPAFYRAYGDPRSAREARRLGRTLLDLCWVRDWKLELTPDAFAECRTYAQVVSTLFEAWARKDGKARWCDKTPTYVTEIPTLLEIFPTARILHIHRDGRDVALSWLRTYFGPRNLYTAARTWRQLVSAGRHAGASLSAATYLEVRYESLLASPAQVMTQVCDFVGEPYTDEVTRPAFLERHVEQAVVGERRIEDASQHEVVAGNRERWRREMSVSDRVLFESLAGDLLRTLGYQTEGRARLLTLREHLGARAHHQFWFLLGQLNTAHKRDWVPSHLRLRLARVRGRLRPRGRAGVVRR